MLNLCSAIPRNVIDACFLQVCNYEYIPTVIVLKHLSKKKSIFAIIYYFHILKENFTIKIKYVPQRWRNHPVMALKEARATPKAVALDADLLKTNYLVRYQTGSLTKIKTGIFKDQGRSSMPAFLGLCPMPQNFWLLFSEWGSGLLSVIIVR